MENETTINSQILSTAASISDSLLSIFELMPQEDLEAIQEQLTGIKNDCENMIRRLVDKCHAMKPT